MRAAHVLAVAAAALVALRRLEEDEWPKEKVSKEATPPLPVPAPTCKSARPLFTGTFEVTTCKLTSKFRVVAGVRKRIVHAELTITVPEGVVAKGSKPVRVTAFWQ